MTEREVLKLALEALEDRSSLMKWQMARDAVKEALREHAMYEVQRLGQEIQPEQEPVAFASHGVINWIADKQFQHEADLYTTPPQRTWVGLTDEEIQKMRHLIDWTAGWSYNTFARAVEAKLKEKNT